MKIMTGAAVKGLKKNGSNVTVTVEAGGKAQEITVDRVISAVGIVGNIENLGLENTGGEGRPHACGDRRILPHRRTRHLRHRRPVRPALAGAQGKP